MTMSFWYQVNDNDVNRPNSKETSLENKKKVKFFTGYSDPFTVNVNKYNLGKIS